MPLRHAIAATATVAAPLVCVAAPQAVAQDEQLAQAQQGCAHRWDWMNFSYQPAGTEAIITSTSPCQLSLNYGDNGNGGFAVLPCEVNAFGAWACASHAHEIMEAPVAWNASVDGAGRLVLTAPPATPLVTKRPKWTTRYTVTNGYIVPFDKRGRLRKGLRLHGIALPSEW